MIFDEEWRTKQAAMLEHAKTRVPMYIGSPNHAHLDFLLSPVQLGWKAKVFSDPKAVSVDLSPHQYVVRVVSGPLIQEIQDIFQWGGGRTLDETWRADSTAYFKRIDEEDGQLPFDERRSRSTRWRYCFSGPVGPRLNEPSFPCVFAKQLYWGVRTDVGLWCEGYEHGWPISEPRLYSGEVNVGMIAAAHLTPEYFTGLPFKEDDVHRLQKPPGYRYSDGIEEWEAPNDVTVRWHSDDDLLTPGLSVEEALAKWL